VIGRRVLLGAAAVATLGPPLGRPARADPALVLIVGAPPGANTDLLARSFAPFLERHLPGRRVDIHNIPGEGGLLAYRTLAETRPDGGVLGWVATPSLPARAVDHADRSLLTRLRLLGAVQREPVVFVCPTSSPIVSSQELIRRSSARHDAVPLGTPPAGSPGHLAALELQVAAGTPLNIVAFPSAAAARQAVLAGNLAAAAIGLGEVMGDLRDGRLAGLGVASAAAGDAAAGLAPLQEAGPSASVTIRRGLAGPAGLTADAVAILVPALRAIVADPDFAEQADQGGFAVDWQDGPAWSLIATEERATLLKLWRANPWLVTGTG